MRQSKKEKYWDLFFTGWSEGHFWVWKIKTNLCLAIQEVGAFGNIADPMEIPASLSASLEEGCKHSIIVNAYERNLVARKICIDKKGYKCAVCGFDFRREYGELGEGFIHVHHLVPISQIGTNYVVDPINDLIPVCPNCHAMLHKNIEVLSVSDLIMKYNNAQLVKNKRPT